MYVQALLLKMAQTTGEISEAMLTYIARVPARDILNIGKASAQQALNIGFKNRSFAEGTPLLLRCCVAMDDKDGTATAQQFVDGVSRLLYAAADVDGDMIGNELNQIAKKANETGEVTAKAVEEVREQYARLEKVFEKYLALQK